MSADCAPNFVRTTSKAREPHPALAAATPLNTTFRCAAAPLNQERIATLVPAPRDSLTFLNLRTSAERSGLVRHIDSCEREVASLQATAIAAGKGHHIEIDGIKPLEYLQMLRDVTVTYLAYVSHFDRYGLDGEARKYLTAASKACATSMTLASQLKKFCEEDIQAHNGVTGTERALRSGYKTATDTTTPPGVFWLHDSKTFSGGVETLISLGLNFVLLGDGAAAADVLDFLQTVYNDPAKVVRGETADDDHVQRCINNITRY